MNIENIFKPRAAPTSAGQSSVVNGTPPCQNIMFPNPFHFFPSSSSQHPYHHQPLIRIPTKTSTTTLGAVGASVDMLRAQVTELSGRMDAVEFNLSEFKNSVSNDIFLLKSTLSEHATEMLNSRDIVEDTHAHVKKTNNLIEQQDVCIDRLAGIVSQSRMRTVASNVDLGMVRRRLSKVEDFTNEFYEQFESFKSVKEIITGLSDHVNECDQDISSFVVKRNEKLEVNDCNTDDSNECDQNILLTFIKNDQEEDDDFEKL
jgi:hypothetical protein